MRAPPLSGGSRYKLSKNNRFRRKNKGLLKESVKLEQAAQSTDGSITVQSEMTMIGLLLNPTKAGFSPEGLLPHEPAMRPRTRLQRLLNGWIAAAMAYRERQAAWLALHRAGDRNLHNKRIYRGPIDDALERAARLLKRRHLKPS
jgi:hypothetical protein